MTLVPRHETLPRPTPSFWRQSSCKFVSPGNEGYSGMSNLKLLADSSGSSSRQDELLSSRALLLAPCSPQRAGRSSSGLRPACGRGRRPAQGAADPLRQVGQKKETRAYHFGSQGPGTSSPTTPATRTAWSRSMSSGERPTSARSWARTAVIATRRRSKPPTVSCPRTPSTPTPSTPTRATSTGCRRRVARGAKHLFIVWFDGLDWPTTQAAAIVQVGQSLHRGEGLGPDLPGLHGRRIGQVSASWSPARRTTRTLPTSMPRPSRSRRQHRRRLRRPDCRTQPLDARPARHQAPGYFKGQSASAVDRAGVRAAGGVLHAYTDSSQSAAEMVSGVKSYNNGLNVADDGMLVPTLFHELQDQGWKVGTVTSVPFRPRLAGCNVRPERRSR